MQVGKTDFGLSLQQTQKTTLREETFVAFIKKVKPPFFFTWPLNLGYVAMIVGFTYHQMQSSIQIAFVFALVITLGFIGLKLSIYAFMYRTYRAGRRAVGELSGKSFQVFEEVGVYIRGFDLFSQKRPFPPDASKTIYDFEYADLVLTDISLILIGKSRSFGGESYAFPVEITFDGYGLTSLPKAIVLNWFINGDRLVLKFQDKHYKSPVEVVFKAHFKPIEEWLTRLNHKFRPKE